MKKIDIITTQNVTIEYELANLRDRFLAWLLDIITMTIGILIIFLFMSIMEVGRSYRFDSWWIYASVGTVIAAFYTLVMESLNNGQTLGKMALRTKVITVNGKNPELMDYVIRWSFRYLELYLTGGSLAAILVSSSSRAQRLGGILSNTTVVRLEPRRYLSLDKLLTITSEEEYKPSFPQIKQLTERDMLTIKSAMDRYSKYKNPAHKEAVMMATARVEETLEISRGEMGHLKFLRTIIKDYIVLTR